MTNATDHVILVRQRRCPGMTLTVKVLRRSVRNIFVWVLICFMISVGIAARSGMSLHRLLRSKALQVFSCRQIQRSFSSNTEGEIRITKILKEKFPRASSLKVVDISGGCGAMYEIHIESDEFRGKRIVQQHQIVNQALEDEIKGMHGLRIFTDVPKK